MDLALALLLLWGLLFTPLGIALQAIVLGEGARPRALPLAPITGIAVAVVVLAALGRIGVDAGDPAVAWGFVVVSIASVIGIWRTGQVWRTRELIGAGLLLLLAAILLQAPVIGDDLEGPLGYGTASTPVTEVAAIDAAAHGPASKLEVADRARATADDRPIGFEQFAALTVAIGLDDGAAADASPSDWSAYGLHAAITAMLVALVSLPLFAFARARGVGVLGLIVLVPLGVLTPASLLALANGAGAAVASVPFTTAAVFSLLVTRRDRGWWALVVLYGAAIAAAAGPLALLPLTTIGLTWMFLRSSTYEHLSQHDAPVATARTVTVTGLAAGCGIFASLSLLGRGDLLAWAPLHDRVIDAVRSWPFGWLDTDLSATGPVTALENAIWLVGPALIIVATIYAIVRNERRELAVLIGVTASVVVTTLIAFADQLAAIRLIEFTLLSTSPFLAALAIRAVALARAGADGGSGGARAQGTARRRAGALVGLGPVALVLVFIVLSFSATTVTGKRMVHAPAVDIGNRSSEKLTTLIAAGDPWLEFVVDGERVTDGYADADELSELGNGLSLLGTRTQGYDRLVLSSSPFASDPGLRYRESAAFDTYQARLFRDQLEEPRKRDPDVDIAFEKQRRTTQAADRPGITADATRSDAKPRKALRHDPVEPTDRRADPARPAGLLLPASGVSGCEAGGGAIVSLSTCAPQRPVASDDCSAADIAAARSAIDKDAVKATAPRPGGAPRAQLVTVETDDQLANTPSMLGVQCFDVELDPVSTVLLVHLRDVGLILPPERAELEGGSGAWSIERDEDAIGGVLGGTRRITSDLDASLSYGAGRLTGMFDIALEGSFGAGVDLTTTLQAPASATGIAASLPVPDPFITVRGSADGWSQIVRPAPLSGVVTVANDDGTNIELGRLVARPRDLPPSCDMAIALQEGALREIRSLAPASSGGEPVERPALTVAVSKIDQEAGRRIAHVAVGTYQSRAGLPRYTLIDWTEQFDAQLEVDGCDGATFVERGTASPASSGPGAFARAIGSPAK